VSGSDEWHERQRAIQAAGNMKAAPDPPPYPYDWTTRERCAAYWFVIYHDRVDFPADTDGWRPILVRARNEETRHVYDHEQLLLSTELPGCDPRPSLRARLDPIASARRSLAAAEAMVRDQP